MKVEEIYEEAIRPLPASDRLRLARLILEGIAPEAVADYDDSWSEEDLREFTLSGWARSQIREEEDA